ncbi:UDP-N-acetylmuramoyl-L-alanyl-D-glutamate--2,6-diaminopimelate ligase [Fuerstiella marisgermanici]|uniref:UDP-N-acetylmuramoyl-L-alanyl-D-glutamate--2,6-diaminopimelate ligase n=1 Tax=Fuerstiella marisgermanici TaxID=1891926 RepID=A0A1P8WB96_9PLAN|nr:UDP-N-acetylmuramoyl-L-alanyl-D-glutamate--2,6-diaminopimelate ligase [Fuerstiella marisgermanici]APZ91338.1 UDP-N-acetylmuramoyl-L-alanyl-D-glutamate--2,6-diaminopimelate ligase [Fuerstiella marisgermanici]
MNSIPVSLQRVLLGSRFLNCADIAARSVTADSRTVLPGDVFVAVAGCRTDGHQHIASAVANGAAAIVVQRPVEGIRVPQCIVPCTAAAFARLCAALTFGDRCPMVSAGITGTNGKTTTSWMLRSILQEAKFQTGLIGTIENSDGVEQQPANMTTPPADRLVQQVGNMLAKRTSHCVIEISSHALTQKRCAGIPLSAAAITNISQDHFDYHGDLQNYRTAKSEIAKLLHPDAPLLLNITDAGCRSVLDAVSEFAPVITFGLDCAEAELGATLLSQTHRSQRICLHLAQGNAEVRLRMIGRHNVENAVAAAGLAEQLGIPLRDIAAGLEAVRTVPGRLERIDEGQPFQVLVDYAHTHDALSRSIATIRDFTPGRIICVFGAGGDRDASKRLMMGQAAAASEVCVVTSDNPRSEDPLQIIHDLMGGLLPGTQAVAEPDRAAAIRQAFELAEPGDVVLLAGKGHETVQEIQERRQPFDDRFVARQLLHELYAPLPEESLHPTYSLIRSA